MRSQPSARLHPAPTATPLTFAIVGLRHAVQRERGVADVAHHRELMTRCGVFGSPTREIGARAEVAAGAGDHDDPIVVALPDLEERRRAARSTSSPFAAFFFSGRFSVIVTMWSLARDFESLHARDDN